MKKHELKYRPHSALLACAMAFSLAACADESKEPETRPIDRKLLPFSIGFDLDGQPVVLDEKGNRIEPTQVTFPIKATEIESVDSISMVQYKGSHVKLIKIGNKYYAIPLPH